MGHFGIEKSGGQCEVAHSGTENWWAVCQGGAFW